MPQRWRQHIPAKCQKYTNLHVISIGTCTFTSTTVRTQVKFYLPYFLALADNCYISCWQYSSMFNVPELTNMPPPPGGNPSSEDGGSLLQWNTENVCTLFCFLNFLCRESQHFTSSDTSDVWWTMFYKNKVINHINFKRSFFYVSTFQQSCHITIYCTFCHTIKQEHE
jgi:hypothetical protein